MTYQVEEIDIKKIKRNPKNPRFIEDSSFEKLVESVTKFPNMLKIRPVVLNKKMMPIGGNMRYLAALKAGFKTIPVIIAKDFTSEQEKEFMIKDNVQGGQWDWEVLANEWDVNQLESWDLIVPFEFRTVESNEESDLNAKKPTTAWYLNIEFDSEQECQAMFDELSERGLKLKIVQ